MFISHAQSCMKHTEIYRGGTGQDTWSARSTTRRIVRPERQRERPQFNNKPISQGGMMPEPEPPPQKVRVVQDAPQQVHVVNLPQVQGAIDTAAAAKAQEKAEKKIETAIPQETKTAAPAQPATTQPAP